jgi:hypothetical protein
MGAPAHPGQGNTIRCPLYQAQTAMNDWTFLLLRLVHIGAGVFWVGAAVTAFAFIEPAVHDLGAAGEKFMRQLTERRKLPEFIVVAGVLNLGSGGVLYWRDSGGLQPEWIASPIGLGFTIGAIAALLGAATAIAFILPTLKKLEDVSRGLPSELAPTMDTTARLRALNRRLHLASLGNVLLLALAVASMATARNWGW